MKLERFIKPVDFPAVLANLCLMLRLLGILLSIPLLVSIIAGEWIYSILFAGMGIFSFGIGSLKYFLPPAEIKEREAPVLTALSYLLFGLIGAVAFLPQASYMNGFFEAMSGFTTTGLSVLNVETLPASLLFFRAYSQWIGGAGIVVLSVVMLVGPGREAFQLYSSEYGEENLAGDVKATGLLVLKVYLLLTAAGYITFVAAGMGYFDALLHVLSTLSTGGFSSKADSIGQYHNPLLNGAVSLFMIFGAIGFPTYYLLRHRGVKSILRDIQVRYLVGISIIASLAFFAAGQWDLKKLIPAIFNSLSAVTTTGFHVGGMNTWPQESKLMSIILMIIGGTTGSTAGGIKIFRLIMMVHLLRWMIRRILLPDEAKLPIKYGNVTLSDTQIKQAFSFLICYAGLIILSTLLLSAANFNIIDSLFESASALGTVGLSSGVTSAALPVWAKLLLIFNMWAGRLEIFPVLLIFYPRVWLPRRKK